MTKTEEDQLVREIAFQDEEFVAKLGEKTVGLLHSHVRMIERKIPEIPKHVITEALATFTAMEIEAALSREHAIDFLRKLTAALEKDNTTTVQ